MGMTRGRTPLPPLPPTGNDAREDGNDERRRSAVSMSLSGKDDAENDWRIRNALDMGQEGMMTERMGMTRGDEDMVGGVAICGENRADR